MDDSKVARVYAESLHAAATEAGRVEEVRRDLEAFVEAATASPELRAFFSDEETAPQEKTHILMELTEGGDALFRNFLRLLVDKDREAVFDDAARLFVGLVEQAAGVVKAELVTAIPIPDSLRDDLRRRVEAALQKQVELSLVVDPEILGGARLRVGDRIADASIRHQLDDIHAILAKPTASVEVAP